MIRLILILILFPTIVSGFDLNITFRNDEYELSKILLAKKYVKISSSKTIPYQFSSRILQDPFNRVDKLFKVSKFFRPYTNFWFNIYTKFPSSSVVIHDKENLSIIYNVLDYSELNSTPIGKYTIAALQSSMTLERTEEIKKALYALRSKTTNYTLLEKKIIQAINRSSLQQLPQNLNLRKKLLKTLAKNLRAQTGQRNAIKQAFLNLYPYEKKIYDLLKQFKAPKELVAISFLESSFNPYARSKSGAVGTWQFLRRSGRSFMKVNKKEDYRYNPLLSTVGAIYLLKQNRQILRRWDLAITAYNSGPNHLIKARRRLRKKSPSLEKILTSYNHPHIGFAVKNYYSEFIALVYTLAYKNEIFSFDEIIPKTEDSILIDRFNLNFFLSKRKFSPIKVFTKYISRSPDLKVLNEHLLNSNRKYNRGTTFISDIPLSSKDFKIIPLKTILSKYPKNWR